MLLSLTEWLAATHSGFNVFQYLTLRAILGALTALAISLHGRTPRDSPAHPSRASGRRCATTARSRISPRPGPRRWAGRSSSSRFRPARLFWADLGNRFVWVVLLVTLLFGAIGWVDDYRKLVRGDPKGPAGTTQVPVAVRHRSRMRRLPVSHRARFPSKPSSSSPSSRTWCSISAGATWCSPTSSSSGTSNAVNLTDGLDGLAILPTVMVAGALGIFAYVTGHVNFSGYLGFPYIAGVGEIVVLCGSIVGAGLGFLWFNTYPAQVFMGDVGALALGAALGIVAVLCPPGARAADHGRRVRDGDRCRSSSRSRRSS